MAAVWESERPFYSALVPSFPPEKWATGCNRAAVGGRLLGTVVYSRDVAQEFTDGERGKIK